MNLFPYNTPELTDADRRRLRHFARNAKDVRLWLKDARPQGADIKRMVLLEMERPQGFREEVIRNLLASLQRLEREGVWEKINRKKRKP
jgi:hypothetical protein